MKESSPPVVVGVSPWLPWPFSAWSWWTEPVRAERLAMLRIGVALCLLIDILYHYAPETLNYFGSGGLGDPTIFNWRFQTPRTTWSLLRGVGDLPTLYLSLGIWFAMTGWILGNTLARLLLVNKNPPPQDRTGIALVLWTTSLAWYVAGLWSRMIVAKEINELAWLIPIVGVSLCCLFTALDLATRLRAPNHRIPWFALTVAWIGSLLLLGLGSQLWYDDPAPSWTSVLRPWQEDKTFLVAAMIVWIASAFLLLIGCATRYAAILAWLLSMSFANANPNLDNAGDTIRVILQLYLMMCPCGAVWSVDAWWTTRAANRKARAEGVPPQGPVYVHPWAIRLVFVQMIFIYCMNGVYKLFGPTWLDGYSLYYVLGDAALTRFSQVQWPLPLWLTRLMTWSVLAWEVTFPVMVLWPWSRRITLVFGVLFHLGIFATMELGGFVPYALCMYLPLVPWERLRRALPAPAVLSGDEQATAL